MKCKYCPLTGDEPCDGEKIPRYCQLSDPRLPCYNPDYGEILKARAESKKSPGLARRILNFASAVVRHAADGLRKVDPEAKRLRLEVCGRCEFNHGGMCEKCGCLLEAKAGWASESCPIKRWHALPKQSGGECGGCGKG